MTFDVVLVAILKFVVYRSYCGVKHRFISVSEGYTLRQYLTPCSLVEIDGPFTIRLLLPPSEKTETFKAKWKGNIDGPGTAVSL